MLVLMISMTIFIVALITFLVGIQKNWKWVYRISLTILCGWFFCFLMLCINMIMSYEYGQAKLVYKLQKQLGSEQKALAIAKNKHESTTDIDRLKKSITTTSAQLKHLTGTATPR